jgi:hypothetical protein
VRNDQPVEVTEETRGIAEHERGLTVEQVLREGVVGHELGDEQALVAIAAVADQVRQRPASGAAARRPLWPPPAAKSTSC